MDFMLAFVLNAIGAVLGTYLICLGTEEKFNWNRYTETFFFMFLGFSTHRIWIGG